MLAIAVPALQRVTGHGGPVSVLVVDDNPDHRTLIRMRLSAGGLQVREASSGEEALRMLDGVQLVLCDYQLPGMNGLQTLEAIRATSDCSVIMVTGAGSESLVVDVLRAGAADYLVKDPSFLTSLPLVIERAWRHHDLSLRAAELERLSLLVSSASDRDEMLGGIVGGARRLLRADTGILYLQRGDEIVEEARDGDPVKEPGLLMAKAQAALENSSDVADELAPTRHLVIPLRFEDLVVGSLAIVTAGTRAYLPEELRLARSFAAFASIALSNLHRLELQQQLVDRLQGLNDLRRDLVASVSHELRTPLTCIVGFSTTLERRWDQLADEQRRTFVGQITKHGGELTEQVERLLDVAALEAGRLSATLRAVDLPEQVSEAIALLEPLLEGRPLSVEVPPMRVIADPTLLRRALSNLVSNAAKYSQAGTEVTVRAVSEGGLAKVEVIDRGVGLSEEDAARAFEPFWRSSSAVAGATRGAGVGLALVKEYLRVMGGDVSVSSQPGMGSVFTMVLPLDAAPAS